MLKISVDIYMFDKAAESRTSAALTFAATASIPKSSPIDKISCARPPSSDPPVKRQAREHSLIFPRATLSPTFHTHISLSGIYVAISTTPPRRLFVPPHGSRLVRQYVVANPQTVTRSVLTGSTASYIHAPVPLQGDQAQSALS